MKVIARKLFPVLTRLMINTYCIDKSTLIKLEAKYHKSCRLMFNNNNLQIAPLNCQSQQLLSALSSACDLKSHFCKQCGPRSSRSSLIRVLTVCLYAKNRFEKFARIFSRQHKQTTFSDDGFLGILRVNV